MINRNEDKFKLNSGNNKIIGFGGVVGKGHGVHPLMHMGTCVHKKDCTGYPASFISGIRPDIRFQSPDIRLDKLFKNKNSFDK